MGVRRLQPDPRQERQDRPARADQARDRRRRTVAVTCKLKGRKADKLLRKVRKAKLTTVRVTTTFTDAAGRTTTSTADVKLKKK